MCRRQKENRPNEKSLTHRRRVWISPITVAHLLIYNYNVQLQNPKVAKSIGVLSSPSLILATALGPLAVAHDIETWSTLYNPTFC